MIELNAVNYETASGKIILENLNCSIQKGEFIVLTGVSGSGKSTFFNVLNGLAPELYEGFVTGTGHIGESVLPIQDFSTHVQQIGVVFQNPKTHFFTTDVYSELAFVMENNGIYSDVISKRIEEMLSFFKLTAFSHSSMFKLSGGQRQLVSIAAANMMHHHLLLLDEPSSNLDFKAVRQLKEALKMLKEQGVTILIAEHRLAYLMDLADRFLLMENGTIFEELSRNDMRSKGDEWRREKGLRSLEEIGILRDKSLEVDSPASVSLEIHNLVCKYRKQSKNALEISQMKIENHGITGIIGENGAGKSTLFDAISGLMRPKSGKIILNGHVLSRKQLLDQTFLVMQDVNLQLFFETVEKELLMQAKKTDRYEEICQRFHLTHLLDRHPHTLSGGEKQRVAIATALLSGKKVLLFDEPTSGLDYEHMREVSALLKSLCSEDVLMIVISHDEEFLKETCQSIIQLKRGSIFQNGSEE